MNTENLPKIKVLMLSYEPSINALVPRVEYMENTLVGLRKIIGCHHVTCTKIEVSGKNFDVWSDDEALLEENPIPSLYIDEDLILFGNLVFAKHDDEGATIGINNEEIKLLMNFIEGSFEKWRVVIADTAPKN